MIKIAPSILSADFSMLKSEMKKLEESNADYVHIDVMDGHFVPNITLGPQVVKAIRPYSNLVFDVHLMIENVSDYIPLFAEAGADIITIHVEEENHIHRNIQQIKSFGKKVGIAINPATPVNMVSAIIDEIEMLLLMTVNPGFGGQKYIESVTKKITEAKELIKSRNLNVDIQVDGGITSENVSKVTKAGANVLVSGSALFKSENMAESIKAFRELEMMK